MRTNILSISRKKMVYIVLAIALLQLVMVIIEFHFMKKGFSGDEVYSYATANSSESMNPLLDMDGTIHINEWLKPEQLFQAVVVTKDEFFNYAHINEILSTDAHPPLYFYLLHFFSSFFMGRFSWIPSIIINSVSIFVGQIFFYRLFLLISENRFQSLLAMIFLGCTTATINMMTFTRNYTLLTALTLIYVFYILRAMRQRSKEEKTTASILLAALFLYLASLTQYLSIIFGFFITSFICIYYLIKKDFRFMLKIGLAMISSISLLILSFHQVIYQLNTDQTSMEYADNYPFPLEIRVSIHILLNEIFGIKTSVYPTMFFFWTFWIIIALIVICLIIRFIFRHDEWFIKIQKLMIRTIRSSINSITKLPIIQYLFILFTVVALVLIISLKFKMYFYYPNSNRYLFILYPYVTILLFVPLFKLLRKNYLIVLLVILFSILSLSLGKKTNIGPSELPLREAVETLTDSDIIIFVPNHFSANSSTFYLTGANQIFYTTKGTFYDNTDLFSNGLSKDKPLYMMYCFPAYNNENSKAEIINILKDFKELGITTMDDDPKSYGAKLIAGVGGHLLLRLR